MEQEELKKEIGQARAWTKKASKSPRRRSRSPEHRQFRSPRRHRSSRSRSRSTRRASPRPRNSRSRSRGKSNRPEVDMLINSIDKLEKSGKAGPLVKLLKSHTAEIKRSKFVSDADLDITLTASEIKEVTKLLTDRESRESDRSRTSGRSSRSSRSSRRHRGDSRSDSSSRSRSRSRSRRGKYYKLKCGVCTKADEMHVVKQLPFPQYMLDGNLVSRKPDFCDLPWYYFVVGELELITRDNIPAVEKEARTEVLKKLCYHMKHLRIQDILMQ